MSSDERKQNDSGVRIAEIISVAERFGLREFFEEKSSEGAGYLYFLLGMLVVNEFRRFPEIRDMGRIKRRGRSGRGRGRPRKFTPDMKPVSLYLKVEELRSFFFKTSGQTITKRQAIKYLISFGEIESNVQIEHIERQVSKGRRMVQEVQRSLAEELGNEAASSQSD